MFYNHLVDKWDSYMSILLGVFLAIATKIPGLNPALLQLFQYYVLAMIAVVIFDTIKNFWQHENALWKGAAILSNFIVLISCILILGKIFWFGFAIVITSLPFISGLLAIPNFMLYLGIFLAIENALWAYVYDHL